MVNGEHDAFLARVLRQVKAEFAFVAEDDAVDLPAALFWVMVRALITEKGTGLRTAAQIVYDYCVRKGNRIPSILQGTMEENAAIHERLEFRQ